MEATKQIKHINKDLSQVNVVEIYIPLEKLEDYLKFSNDPDSTSVWGFTHLPGVPKFRYSYKNTIRFKNLMFYI